MAKRTANEAYQRNRGDIEGLLDLLREEVTHAAEHARNDGVNWAHVGSMAHVREGLVETLAFLARQDEAFIEKRLAAVRRGRK